MGFPNDNGDHISGVLLTSSGDKDHPRGVESLRKNPLMFGENVGLLQAFVGIKAYFIEGYLR